MLRKYPLVSLTALLTLIVVIVCAVISNNSKTEGKIKLPDTVSVYVAEETKIITLSYEDFISGCIFGMMNPKCEREALKSAVCAVNTTALYLLENRRHLENNGADFSTEVLPYQTTDKSKEQYGEKYERYRGKVAECVDSAIDTVILYDGAPICAACCAISTGRTEDSSEVSDKALPYLCSVSCEFDKEAKGCESNTQLSSDFVCKSLRSVAEGAVLSGHPEEWFTAAEYAKGGTLLKVDYGGVSLSGAQLMSALGLRSSAIKITFADDGFKFICSGRGENLGMSLNGANVLALQGMKMEDILMYFYTGCEVVDI